MIRKYSKHKNWTNVGKYIRQLYDEFQGLETTSEKFIFLKSRIPELLTLGLFIESAESINVIVYYLISWYVAHYDDG